jgi:hypothetical protein
MGGALRPVRRCLSLDLFRHVEVRQRDQLKLGLHRVVVFLLRFVEDFFRFSPILVCSHDGHLLYGV